MAKSGSDNIFPILPSGSATLRKLGVHLSLLLIDVEICDEI